MNPLLSCAIALVRAWTRTCTWRMEPSARDRRRAEIESDLWEFHEDLRRRGASPSGIAIHMLARLVMGIPNDLLWRLECERDRDLALRRSTWTTMAAVGAAAGIAALWVLFTVSSLGALPPLPDSVHVERVYLRALPPPPPPPPPPQPAGLRVPVVLMPPPPPPPPR
jgi:hypothetical protein